MKFKVSLLLSKEVRVNPLFCFDIDGTLLDNIDQKFHESEIQTLKDLKKAGYKISIATGRSFQSVKSTGLLDLVEWDGLVLNNGQVVCDRFGNIQHIIYIEDESFQRLKKICDKKDWNYSIETGYDWFTIKENDPNTLQAHEFFCEILPRVKSYEGEKVVMLMVYAPIGHDYHEFDDIPGLSIFPGESSYADVCAKDVNKWVGIQKLLNHLGLNECVAFGDGSNDIDMLMNATIGVAMGQSSQAVKEKADFVTKSCQENGVTYACRKYNFIK